LKDCAKGCGRVSSSRGDKSEQAGEGTDVDTIDGFQAEPPIAVFILSTMPLIPWSSSLSISKAAAPVVAASAEAN